MNVTAEFPNANEMQVSLTITMPLKDWTHMMKSWQELKSDRVWPCAQLSGHISDALYKITSKVYADPVTTE